MEEFFGKKYIISSKTPSVNFDEFLMFMGYNYVLRVAAKAVSPIHCLVRNPDGTYTFTLESKLVNISVTFRLGEEYEEEKPGPFNEKFATQTNPRYTFSLESGLLNLSVTFRLGEEYEEKKPGPFDEKLKSLMTMEGNVLTQRQTEESGRTSTHVREFFADRMITTTSVTGWDKVMTRYYDLMES